MKKIIVTVLVLAVALCALSSCTAPREEDASVGALTVSIISSSVTVKAGEPIDITELFTVTVNGNNVAINESMLDLGGLDINDPAAGSYTVILSYTAQNGLTYNKQSSVKVESDLVETVKISHVDRTIISGTPFDPKTLFTLSVGGVSVAVTDEMLDLGDFDPETPALGEYKIAFTYKSSDGKLHAATAAIKVVDGNSVTVSAEPASIKEDCTDFDLKSMFTVTAYGEEVTVTDAMIDAGSFNSAAPAPGEYEIKLTYTSADGLVYTASAILTVKTVWIGPF